MCNDFNGKVQDVCIVIILPGIWDHQNSQGVFWSRGIFKKIFIQERYTKIPPTPIYSRCLDNILYILYTIFKFVLP